jgi:multiple antibiotic resistance protein
MSTWTWLWGDFTNDFITIWVIIDPISALPVFIALTSEFDRVTQCRIAGGAVLISLVVLFFFICLGQLIITAMGISIRTFEIAGGLILFIFAVELVIGETKKPDIEATRETPMQLAIYPLAIPNLAGPGAMLTVILRTNNSSVNWLEQLHTTAAVAGVLAITFLLMLAAGPITRVIGIGGANVVKRIMGMIIAAYAAHLVFSGVGSWLHLEPL